MPSSSGDAYEFGPFRLEPAERRLLHDGVDISLPPKALDLLVALVSRPGRLVKKETLLEEVWPGVFVEEANLSYTISLLRKAIEEGNGDQRYIDTVPKQGYRFKVDIRRVTGDIVDQQTVPGEPDAEADEPRTSIEEQVAAHQTMQRLVRRWRYAAAGVGALGVLGLSLMAVLYRHVEQPATFSSAARFDITLPEDFRLPPRGHPVISPDGRRGGVSYS